MPTVAVVAMALAGFFAASVSGGTGGGAPNAPLLLSVSPDSPANENHPRITGSAQPGTTVALYTNPSCSGDVAATGSADDLAAGMSASVPDDSTTDFFGAASLNALASPCSASPVSYREDSTPPKPPKTTRHTQTFRFTDTTGGAAGSSFLCKLDKAKRRGCTAPRTFRGLHIGTHTFQVKAVDAAGNQELKGAKRRFKVIRAP